jgi:PAS domain S-box-containing protein
LVDEGHEVVTVESYPKAVTEITEKKFDLIFSDIILNGHSGMDVLRLVKEKGMNCPVVMITGQPDIENASESVRLGAFDYLAKPINKQTLLHVTKMALKHKALSDEKEKADAEKERYRRNLEAIFRSVNDAVITVNQEMGVIEVNDSLNKICGLTPSEIVGKCFRDFTNPCAMSCRNVLKETLEKKNTVQEFQIKCKHKDRLGQVVVLNSSPLLDQNKRFCGAVMVIRDITRLSNLEEELRGRHQFHSIIGKSKKMQEIYGLLENLVDTDTTVLITGESGTGKELVAKALHYNGTRAGSPMVTVNCAALSENLLESELFGHVKGAFTGAIRDKLGRFEAADKGTILLDEIGDISPNIQLKLLRVLQEKEFERVGDTKPIKVDVRVIASTNCDLKTKIQRGEFREDLFYRLKVVEVNLPSLRERSEDIPLLVKHFCRLFNHNFNKHIEGVSGDVMEMFMHYRWSGNIRELEHALEHAFVLCQGRTIEIGHLPAEFRGNGEFMVPQLMSFADDESQTILKALQQTGWNKARASRLLGISRQTIYRKIDEYKIPEPVLQ